MQKKLTKIDKNFSAFFQEETFTLPFLVSSLKNAEKFYKNFFK